MSDDDDLRFGDISGTERKENGIVDNMIQLIEILIVGFVLIKVIEILFNIPIPVV